MTLLVPLVAIFNITPARNQKTTVEPHIALRLSYSCEIVIAYYFWVDTNSDYTRYNRHFPMLLIKHSSQLKNKWKNEGGEK